MPQYIRSIALLTGKDSAAQSDFLKILKENNAGVEVDFYPVQVQGKYSEREIISTLKSLNYSNYDCIALVRGGGSLEDLITFNSENLARTIFGLPIPIIVGVGHEKDESIADYVADIRASTPSQAAYYIISNNENFINALDLLIEKIGNFLSSKITDEIALAEQNLILINQKLLFKVKQGENSVEMVLAKLLRLPREILYTTSRIESTERLLQSFNPMGVLKRGYSILKNDDGIVVKSVSAVSINENINLILHDGELSGKILNKKINSTQ